MTIFGFHQLFSNINRLDFFGLSVKEFLLFLFITALLLERLQLIAHKRAEMSVNIFALINSRYSLSYEHSATRTEIGLKAFLVEICGLH